MSQLDLILMAYYLGIFMFALNGIGWIALHRKVAEIKASEERIVRLLMRSKIRRVK